MVWPVLLWEDRQRIVRVPKTTITPAPPQPAPPAPRPPSTIPPIEVTPGRWGRPVGPPPKTIDPPFPPTTDTQPFSLLSGQIPWILKKPQSSGGPSEPYEFPPQPSNSPAKIVSKESGLAPFETLFHDFNLQAIPFYNYWEKSEETSTHERGSQKLEDLPRYVKLSWIPAPDIPDPDAFNKRRAQGQDPGARDQFTQLSPFGFGSHAVVGNANNGMLWTPPHLQPENFPQNANALANGNVFAGALEAVVEVQTGSIAAPPKSTSALIDEDQYLAHPEVTWGMPFSEFNAAMWRWKSRTFGAMMRLAGVKMSPGATLQRTNLVSGQYAIAPQAQGIVDLRAVNSSSPAISFAGMSAESQNRTQQSRIFELADQLGASYLDDGSSEFQRVKIKMLHTNLEGLMSQERLDSMSTPAHAEVISAIAPFAGNMAVYSSAGLQGKPREVSIPSFNAPNTLKPLEYVGYVIEKYEQVDGSFKRVETFYVPGRDYTSYFDCRVKYGVAYRYRIRAIIRWCRQHKIGIFGRDPTVIDAPGAGLNSLTPNDVSYFGSEWGNEWASALLIDTSAPPPPHQFQVRSDSKNKYIEVTFCLPYNPQQDINKMTLWRKLQDQDGFDLTDWVQVQEVDAQERQGTRHLFVTDLQHEQDDITGTKFNATETEQVQTFVEYAPVNSRYVDTDVGYFGEDNSYKYVYSALCHTRHGETSVMSDQLAARLNPHWQRDGEFPLDFVSCAGVNKDFDTGIFGTYPEQRLRSEVVFKPVINATQNEPGMITFSGQPRQAQNPVSGASYVARIESLDTGQHVDVTVNLDIKNLPEENSVEVQQALVRAQ